MARSQIAAHYGLPYAEYTEGCWNIQDWTKKFASIQEKHC